MHPPPRQLPIPELALEDTHAVELVRVWASGGKQHVSIATGLWDDPGSWGIMLVDLAKHVANAYQLARGMDRADVLNRVKLGFDAEWGCATDEPTGELQG